MPALARGFVDKFPNRSPPRAARGFEWPSLRAATDAQRLAFKKFMTSQMRAQGINHRDLARLFFGETKTAQGYTTPRNPNTILEYADGSQFPAEERARQIGAFFKVPIDSMLVDDGKPFEPLPLIRPKRATSERKKKNGHGKHGGNGAAGNPIVRADAPASTSEPEPPRPLPKGAKPVTVKIETLPGASEFCHVEIAGTVPLDVGLGMMAFIDRATHRPRK
jgi:hypothetical protein